MQNPQMTAEQAKEAVSTLEALQRLEKNPDFQKVVKELYIEKEPQRLVSMLTHFPNDDSTQREAILKSLQSVSDFGGFLITIRQLGNAAKQALLDDDQLEEAVNSDVE